MSSALRRALTNAVRAYEDEARRRRLSVMGGAEAMEAEAKLIRDNMDALCGITLRTPGESLEAIARREEREHEERAERIAEYDAEFEASMR